MGSSPICRTVLLVDGDFQNVVATFYITEPSFSGVAQLVRASDSESEG